MLKEVKAPDHMIAEKHLNLHQFSVADVGRQMNCGVSMDDSMSLSPTLSFGFLAEVISQRKDGDVTQSCSTLEVQVPKLSSPFFLENEKSNALS
jgi:hypothetical protein